MRYTLHSGESSEIQNSFLKDGFAVDFQPGFPIVTILDENDRVVSTFPTSLTNTPGNWSATITIPDIVADDIILYSAKWFGIDQSENEYSTVIPIILHPESNTQSGDIVVTQDDPTLEFILPSVLSDVMGCTITIYRFNEAVMPASNPTTIRTKFSQTVISYDVVFPDPSLVPYLVIAKYITGTVTNQAIFNLWVVTPRILSASSVLESWINKAKIGQTLQQLEYSQADLMMYLERGGNLMNSYPPMLSSFTYTNAQGVIFELWILCATYYALGAQLLAEGALSFDFSGQAVTLNVDRTPSLESALGRIESQMSERVPAAKRLMAKSGITGGDGSAGNMLSLNPVALGRVGISNSPTTVNVPWNSAYNNSSLFRRR